MGTLSRRDFARLAGLGGVGLYVGGRAALVGGNAAHTVPAAAGLSDPSVQPKFVELAPNALDPAFLFKDLNDRGKAASRPDFRVRIAQTVQQTGLVDPRSRRRLRPGVKTIRTSPSR